MKTLHIVRHAKSSWKDRNLTDFERPLNKRGKANAAFMSAKFAKSYAVDLIVSSPARRAKDTALCFAQVLGMDEKHIRFEDGIYASSVSDIQSVIASIPNEIDTVILFGHNPALTELAWHCDPSFTDHLVTCARVQIEFDTDEWGWTARNRGKAVEHVFPKMYPEMQRL